MVSYQRDDGDQTWFRGDDFLVRHDLSHYAIDNILGYRTAFLGMINQGMDIRDFEDRGKRGRLQITMEAWYAENLANLFLIELSQGKFEDFNRISQATMRQTKPDLPPLYLDSRDIGRIRSYLQELIDRWNSLPPGKQLILEY